LVARSTTFFEHPADFDRGGVVGHVTYPRPQKFYLFRTSDVFDVTKRSSTPSPTSLPRSMSSKAGPSRTPKKRSANGQDGPASKNPRIDDDEYDATGGAGVDPMEALEGKGDAMEALESGGDAMEALEMVKSRRAR
jgi:hypothetical protein